MIRANKKGSVSIVLSVIKAVTISASGALTWTADKDYSQIIVSMAANEQGVSAAGPSITKNGSAISPVDRSFVNYSATGLTTSLLDIHTGDVIVLSAGVNATNAGGFVIIYGA